MNILHIMPYVPYPISGAPVREYNIIKYLSEGGVNSQVVCNFSTDNEISNINSLEKELNIKIYTAKVLDISALEKTKVVLFYRMHPQIYRYNTTANKEMIISALKNNSFDIVHAQTSISATSTLDALSYVSFKGCKILTLHNVDHLNFIKLTQLYKNPMMRIARKWIVPRLKEHELAMISKFDHLIVVSNVDKATYISKGIPENKIEVIPNGVDCNFFKSEKIADNPAFEHPCILFMGKLDYKPNDTAVKVYLQHIHPIIKEEIPKIKFYVIGKNCPEWLKRHPKIDNSVEVIGFVDDVRPYIGDADVCIVPLTAGSGTRLKILEYMAMSKPVVATTVGVEGLDIRDNKNILISDDWNKFADKIIDLLNDEELSKKIGTNGRKLVEDKYDWKKIVETQIRVYEKLLER